MSAARKFAEEPLPVIESTGVRSIDADLVKARDAKGDKYRSLAWWRSHALRDLAAGIRRVLADKDREIAEAKRELAELRAALAATGDVKRAATGMPAVKASDIADRLVEMAADLADARKARETSDKAAEALSVVVQNGTDLAARVLRAIGAETLDEDADLYMIRRTAEDVIRDARDAAGVEARAARVARDDRRKK